MGVYSEDTLRRARALFDTLFASSRATSNGSSGAEAGKGNGKGTKRAAHWEEVQAGAKSAKSDKRQVECWHCKKKGHYAKDCWYKDGRKSS